MGEGQTAVVTVVVVNGGWGTLDVAGSYWASDEPASIPDGEYEATATLTKAGTIAGGGTVLVDLGEQGSFTFTGPVGCE
jgi:hypothetical protein